MRLWVHFAFIIQTNNKTFVTTFLGDGMGGLKWFHIKYSDNGQNSLEITLNPLRPNNDLSQTSHCNIKGLSVSEVMRIENKITPVKFY